MIATIEGWKSIRESRRVDLIQVSCYIYYEFILALFSSHPINLVNAKKKSHRMFRHMHGVLNEVYLQNFLHRWAVNRETNLTNLLNP